MSRRVRLIFNPHAAAPAAKSDDGLLDYPLIRRRPRPIKVRLIPETLNGAHGRSRSERQGRSGGWKCHPNNPCASTSTAGSSPALPQTSHSSGSRSSRRRCR